MYVLAAIHSTESPC